MHRTGYDACRALILTVTLFLSACDDGPPDGPPPPPPPGGTLQIQGPTEATAGDTIQFRAVHTANNSRTDVTSSAQWGSSNPSVLSVTAGLVTVHAVGLAAVTARFEQLQTNRGVRVVANAGLNGAYTLTLGGANCPDEMPAELTERTYAATVTQRGTTLEVLVLKGGFIGRLGNGNVSFELLDYSYYGYHGPSVWEVLPNGNLLVISGWVTARSSPSGFSGTLEGGVMTLYPPDGPRSIYPLDKGNAIATCTAQGFSLMRG